MMKETYREDDNQLDGVSEQPGELLAEAMEALGFGIMLVAKDGFITFANAVARELMQRGDGLAVFRVPENGLHAANGPAGSEIFGPRKLDERIEAVARNVICAGRQTECGDHRCPGRAR